MLPNTINNKYSADDIPFSGKPKTCFCSLIFKSNADGLTTDDYFYLRDKLLGFLLPYKPSFTFPFGYTNSRQNELMVCFECSPVIKEPLEKYIHNTCRLGQQFQMKALIESFDREAI